MFDVQNHLFSRFYTSNKTKQSVRKYCRQYGDESMVRNKFPFITPLGSPIFCISGCTHWCYWCVSFQTFLCMQVHLKINWISLCTWVLFTDNILSCLESFLRTQPHSLLELAESNSK